MALVSTALLEGVTAATTYDIFLQSGSGLRG